MLSRAHVFAVSVAIVLSPVAYGVDGDRELTALTAKVQANPSDLGVRETVIKYARKKKHQPPLPDGVERRMVRGATAFKEASSPSAFVAAAEEFREATLMAPWYGDAYFNEGLAWDKAEQYDRALDALRLALLCNPAAKETQTLLYEVEYRAEKGRVVRQLEGAQWRFVGSGADRYCHEDFLEVYGGEILDGTVVTRLGPNLACWLEASIGDTSVSKERAKVTGQEFTLPPARYGHSRKCKISDDTRRITCDGLDRAGSPKSYEFERVDAPRWRLSARR